MAWVAPLLVVIAALVLAVVAVRRWTLGAARPRPIAGAVGDPSASQATAQSDALALEDRRLLEHALASVDDEPD